jgi:DNA-binding SARP family transcriptional activator
MEYRVMGPLQVVCDNGAPAVFRRPERQLVAVLLAFAGEPCGRDMLVRAIWGDSPPASPVRALQICLCRARRAMGPGSCLCTPDPGRRPPTQDGALCADPGPGDLDLTRFLQLRAAALRLLGQGRLRPASEALQQALACWRHPPLPGLHLEQALACWRNPPLPDLPDLPAAPEVAARAELLLEQRRLAWFTLADVLLDLGDHDRLLPHLHARVVADPLCERSWAQLMLALHQSGRSGEALAAYSKARAQIVRALGTEPGAELQHLRDQVLAGQAVIVPVQWPWATMAGNTPASLAARGG